MALTPEDCFKHINQEADRALKAKISKFDMSWGKWSSEMNRHIQEQIKSGSVESAKFKIVFYYWVIMSQAIEYAHKKHKKMSINENRFKNVVTMIEEIKYSIEKGCWPTLSTEQIEQVIGVS